MQCVTSHCIVQLAMRLLETSTLVFLDAEVQIVFAVVISVVYLIVQVCRRGRREYTTIYIHIASHHVAVHCTSRSAVHPIVQIASGGALHYTL